MRTSLLIIFLICHVALKAQVEMVILGTVQDAGSPQIGCQKDCCSHLWDHPDHTRKVASIGFIDYTQCYTMMVDATPDIKSQLNYLQGLAGIEDPIPNLILLTHAHIGHYMGLLQLGKEAINAQRAGVAAMPRMANFLRSNGPWNQLVENQNIELLPIISDSSYPVTDRISYTPILVPHRDEYSETVGYRITGPEKSVLYIPDIDKWHLWEHSIIDEIAKVDYALLDASFYDGEELGGRDMSLIPHPTVEESLSLFKPLSKSERNKVYFIHLNHTNPLLDTNSRAYKYTTSQGYHIASYGQVFKL